MRPWVVRSHSRFCCAAGGRIGGEPMTTKERYGFWLSFSDPDAPRGKRFLGVAIVDMDTRPRPSRSSGIRGSLASIRAGLSQSHDLMTGAHCASQESTETS